MAIGFLEVAGYGTALYAMDQACKAAKIQIIGVDTINPKDSSAHIPLTVQIKFQGSVSDVNTAMVIARKYALRFNSNNEIVTSVIKNPYKDTKKLSCISKV